ncbi:ABC-2 type transporter [Corchorus capsularis]|uniref:ABC-2 type transporter n=1 Tax=Corchorus capsularis TaxID=210143 RepID=A0A1R3G1C7_COCAP|nr:ABC-2 type transporter [Corchorus capsularis]
MESAICIVLTYYRIGFAPAASRFFRQFLAFFAIHQMSLSLFRFIAAVGRTQVVANTMGTFALLLVFVLGGFFIAKGQLRKRYSTRAKTKAMEEEQDARMVRLEKSHNEVKDEISKMMKMMARFVKEKAPETTTSDGSPVYPPNFEPNPSFRAEASGLEHVHVTSPPQHTFQLPGSYPFVHQSSSFYGFPKGLPLLGQGSSQIKSKQRKM